MALEILKGFTRGNGVWKQVNPKSGRINYVGIAEKNSYSFPRHEKLNFKDITCTYKDIHRAIMWVSSQGSHLIRNIKDDHIDLM